MAAPHLLLQFAQLLRVPVDAQTFLADQFQRLIGEFRQLRQLRRPARRLVAHRFQQTLHAAVFRHPAFEERLRRFPQIEIRIELASEPLDVEQRLLQQHQLRLHARVEAPRGLEQIEQQAAEGDVLERALEDRFAHAADRRFEFIDAGMLGHPFRLHVQFGDAAVIAVEESEEVLRQIALVLGAQRAHDAEIDGDVLSLRADEDVARMHVSVEEVVAEHLGEEDLHAAFGELLEVDVMAAQRVDVADGNAVDTLHHHDVLARVRPEYFGHIENGRVGEIAAQLRGVGCFAHQIELVHDGFFVFGDHFARTQAAPFGPVALDVFGDDLHQPDVALDAARDAGTHHLDDDLAAVVQGGGMDLGDRGRGERLLVEREKDVLQRLAVGLLDDRARDDAGEGRHVVLQMGELFGEIIGQQIAARGQDLAELDEDRSEILQRAAYAPRARRAVAAKPVPRQQVHDEAHRTEQRQIENDLVETMPDQHQIDMNQPDELPWMNHAAGPRRTPPPCARSAACRRSIRCCRRSPSARSTSTAFMNASVSWRSASRRLSSRRYSPQP